MKSFPAPRPRALHWLLLAPLACAQAQTAGDDATQQALQQAFYDFEVAGYCGLINGAVGAGFQREVQRIRGDTVIDPETLTELRGKAWQAAHWEWQNRGLGGYRAWCRNEGKAAADRFLAVP